MILYLLPRHPTEIHHQFPHRLVAVRRIAFKRLLYDAPQSRRDRFRQGWGCRMDDLLQYLEVRGAGEGPLTAQGFVQHDSEGEDVTSRIDSPS